MDNFQLNSDKFIELSFTDEHNAFIVQQCFPDHPGELTSMALDQSTTGFKKFLPRGDSGFFCPMRLRYLTIIL